jgi:hypothetical protein
MSANLLDEVRAEVGLGVQAEIEVEVEDDYD